MVTKQQVFDALKHLPETLPGIFAPLTELRREKFAAHFRPELLARGLTSAEVDAAFEEFFAGQGYIKTPLQRVVVALDLGWDRYDYRSLYDDAGLCYESSGDGHILARIQLICRLACLVAEQLVPPADPAEIATAIVEALRKVR